MTWVLLAIVALLTLIICLGLASQAHRLKFLAMPDKHRHHQIPTPMVGGIAMGFGLLIGCVLIDSSYQVLMPSLLMLCVVGALDDRYGLPSWLRFLVQTIAGYLMIKLTGVELTSLGFLVSDNEFLLGNWSVPLTLFAVIGVINAVNMSDGLDGLAGSMVLLVILSLLTLGSQDKALLLISASTIIGFLVLNIRIGRAHAKVFMGDAGSTMLGLLLAYLLIKASQSSDLVVTVTIDPVTALWLLALPLIDAVGVLMVRPIKGRSPFSADRIHYHHQMLDRGLSVNGTLATALALQLIFIALGIVLAAVNMNQALQFYSFLGLFCAYFFFLLRKS